MKRIHIAPDELPAIADALTGNLLLNGNPGEATVGDVTLAFGGKVSVHGETGCTGVEHLGEKEHYTKTIISVSDLHVTGAFDAEGEVLTDLDIRQLPLACDCNTHSVTVRFRKAGNPVPNVRKTVINLRRLILRPGLPSRPVPAA